MRMFYFIENIIEWHQYGVVQSISILCWVEETTIVPHFMDTFGNCCRPHFPDDFIETYRSHMVEIVTTSYFGCQFDDLSRNQLGHVRADQM